ncbi:TIGR01777 family oxidoreductase [Methylogaea oryzae]|uniref:Epimerase n=1 Tax=Methylogaea oryzae TaxID=1295382 RepID=A0A8D4VQC5_9GAMM|nr:TIGR01777 family oxidoreductase [Methylogaea oryzae]BBL71409.1 epimerase [Methylogaea oryzae]
MDILLTGGTGFIGRSLCTQLLQQGHNLTLLSRSPAKTPALFDRPVQTVAALRDLTPDRHFHAVVNLAGEPIMDARWTAKRKQALLDSRVGITRQLLDFMARAERKPAVLLSGSAIGWYGDQGDKPLNETATTDAADFGHSLCRQWEQAALEAEALGVRVCLLRTGLVIGKNGGFLARMLPAFRLGLGARLGHGRQWMSWIHLDDHVAMTCKLLDDAALSGPFNLTAPHPVTNAEFTQTLAAALHRPALLPLPAWPLKLAMGEMAELLLGGQRVLPERLLQAGYRFKFPTLDLALSEAIG